jgi:hypothetical protein
MHSYMVADKKCGPDVSGCGGRIVAGVYFYTYMLMAAFTLLKLFVAVCVRAARGCWHA